MEFLAVSSYIYMRYLNGDSGVCVFVIEYNLRARIGQLKRIFEAIINFFLLTDADCFLQADLDNRM